MFHAFKSLKTPLFVLAFLAAIWLAVGNSVLVMVAASRGQPIDITICTSMGVKKIALGETGLNEQGNSVSKDPHAPAAMKHCGNAAFAVLLMPPVHPGQLRFSPPSTVATWQFLQVLGNQYEHTRQSAPPPLRGPPSVAPISALA